MGFLHLHWHVYCSSCSAPISAFILVRLHWSSLWHFQETRSLRNLLRPLVVLQIPSSRVFPEPKLRECFVNGSIETGIKSTMPDMKRPLLSCWSGMFKRLPEHTASCYCPWLPTHRQKVSIAGDTMIFRNRTWRPLRRIWPESLLLKDLLLWYQKVLAMQVTKVDSLCYH